MIDRGFCDIEDGNIINKDFDRRWIPRLQQREEASTYAEHKRNDWSTGGIAPKATRSWATHWPQDTDTRKILWFCHLQGDVGEEDAMNSMRSSQRLVGLEPPRGHNSPSGKVPNKRWRYDTHF